MIPERRIAIISCTTIIVIYLILYAAFLLIGSWAVNLNWIWIVLIYGIIGAVVNVIIGPILYTTLKNISSLTEKYRVATRLFVFVFIPVSGLYLISNITNKIIGVRAPNNFILGLISVWTIGSLSIKGLNVLRKDY